MLLGVGITVTTERDVLRLPKVASYGLFDWGRHSSVFSFVGFFGYRSAGAPSPPFLTD
jgi:hypothetical protein